MTSAPYLAEMTAAVAAHRVAAALIEEIPWGRWIFRHRTIRAMLARGHREIAGDIERWAAMARAAEIALDRMAEEAREEALNAEREARWRKRARVVLLPTHRDRGPDPLDPRPAA